MRIIARIPNKKNIIYNSFEDLNSIWMLLNDYKNVELAILDDKEEINESIINEIPLKTSPTPLNMVTLNYTVPKKVTFTQRFQDRIKKEISDILNTVYPNMFVVDDIAYNDITDDDENMFMYINIKVNEEAGNSEEAINKLNYLDKNVEYILKDIVDYYI